jgi:phage tail protein X
MSATYVTMDGDRLDQIVRAYYGSEKGGNTEAVINANRGLAELGPIYGAGVEIFLPDLVVPTTPTKQVVSLWT